MIHPVALNIGSSLYQAVSCGWQVVAALVKAVANFIFLVIQVLRASSSELEQQPYYIEDLGKALQTALSPGETFEEDGKSYTFPKGLLSCFQKLLPMRLSVGSVNYEIERKEKSLEALEAFILNIKHRQKDHEKANLLIALAACTGDLLNEHLKFGLNIMIEHQIEKTVQDSVMRVDSNSLEFSYVVSDVKYTANNKTRIIQGPFNLSVKYEIREDDIRITLNSSDSPNPWRFRRNFSIPLPKNDPQ